MIAERTTYRRPDASYSAYWQIEEEPEYRDAPGVPGPALDTTDPSVSLLCAILERAILDLGGRGADGSCHRQQAQVFAVEAFEWIASCDEDVWSFVWVCDHLNLSVSATRQRMFLLATRMRRPKPPLRGVAHASEYRRAL